MLPLKSQDVPAERRDSDVRPLAVDAASGTAAPDDIEVMARGLSLNEEQMAMAASLEIGNAIVCGDQDDGTAWIKVAPHTTA